MDFELWIHEIYIFEKDSFFKELKVEVELLKFVFLFKITILLLFSESKKKKENPIKENFFTEIEIFKFI